MRAPALGAPPAPGRGPLCAGLVAPRAAARPGGGRSAAAAAAPSAAAALTAAAAAAVLRRSAGGRRARRGAGRARGGGVARAAEEERWQEPQKIPSRAQGFTLRARIWDMLGLRHDAKREEIKTAYKDFVRTSHPDLQPTQDRDEFQEKFTILTAEYNRVMNMSDEQIFWEAFDTGITRMATKRVDGPSLNPWERKFRQRAREQGRLEVDELEYDVDCRKQAELYLEGCAVDPSMESCGADDRSAEVLQELGVRPNKDAQLPSSSPSMESFAARGSTGPAAAAPPRPQVSSSEQPEDLNPAFIVGTLGALGASLFTFLAAALKVMESV